MRTVQNKKKTLDIGDRNVKVRGRGESLQVGTYLSDGGIFSCE